MSAPPPTMTDHSSAAASAPTDTTDYHSQPLFPNLPNDVALQCLARVPRSHHPSLSLVCKSWRSIIRSPLLYSTRRSLNSTESFLYLNVRLLNPNSKDATPSFKWFVLDVSTATNNINHQNPNPEFLISVLQAPRQAIGASIVALGPKVYVIGGSIDRNPTSDVWILNTESNEWEMGPKMQVGREFSAAGVVNGKIYVIGGCVVNSRARSMNWAEVFDPITSLWSAVPSPTVLRDGLMHASAVVDGRIYGMADRGGVVFDPSLEEWNPVSKRLDLGWRGRAAVVAGILYSYDFLGKIKGFDVVEDVWKELRGVEKDLPKFLSGATMTSIGGRLLVLWEGKGKGKEIEVLCAAIEIKKDDGGELWGSIIWSDVILRVPMRSSIVHCLTVAV
ncbi:hypothetical protein Nepgr_025834 [Nepenthes gracilis]|uniref:F-box domain-containing protein n=1 Tax=Nepenthes gracilis TaxID=150966 RepID=A0AAD3T8K7_NEPGR|nr:hypothetical protein Nepgr_025834 [Nepenthes gracilis]